MTLNIHYFQHVPFEGLALIEDWATSRNHSLTNTRFFDSDYQLPDLEQLDALVILGGPMSVNDEHLYPWLEIDKRYIKQAIDAGKYVLGICLGAQLIAHSLGAKVAANPAKEIGWFPIAISDNALGHKLLKGINLAMTVLHWHGEGFEIPKGALSIASSEASKNQGFIYGDKTLALQFHIEMDSQAVEKIVHACGNEILAGGTYVQNKETILNGSKTYHLKQTLFRLLDNWTATSTP